MGLNPPVPQQDSNWEIRVAVLLSLFLQTLLIFLGPVRRRSSALWSRLTVWSCYLLADWVADLALGLILNNLGNIGGGGGNSSSSFGLKRGGATASNSNDSGSSSSPTIFAFWTPFLLLHLGGPDTITAYSVEDNELWPRHLIGLLFELFSAAVIFFCTLHGNPLIHATVLMFIVGVIKYGERTYSLYCGSLERFRSNILGPPVPGRNYAKFMTEFDSKEKAGLVVEIAIPNGEASIAWSEMEEQETKRQVLDSSKSMEARAYEFFLIFRRLFVNLILSSRELRLSQAFFLRDTEETQRSFSDQYDDEKGIIREAFEVIEVELNFIYDMVYTKAPAAYTSTGWVLRCICSACLISVLYIFLSLDKPGHQIQRVDVAITYALLLGGLALDLMALFMLLFSNRTKVYLEEAAVSSPLRWLARACLITRAVIKRWSSQRWSGTVAQFNLISYCLGVPDSYGGILRGCCLKITKMLGASRGLPLLQDLFFIHHQSLRLMEYRSELYTKDIFFEFIFRGLKDGLHKLKIEQEERKKAAAQKLQETKAAAGTGTRTLEEATEEEIEAKNKDAIAEVRRRRGDGVVKSHEYDIKRVKETTDGYARFKVLLDSVVKSDFDESLLLWHIATDLCRYRAEEIIMPAAAGDARESVLMKPMGPPTQIILEMQAIGKTVSEYMLYLLIKQPEMLSARTGIWLMRYHDTCEEARRFFGSTAAWNPNHADARRMLLRVNTTKKPVQVKGDQSKSVLFDAVILAKALLELDEELMWDIITGVWGEMLTYAASKCPGSTHVQQLNRGGELITLVWLVLEHMGLGDMYNIKTGVDNVAKIIVHDH